MCSYTYDCPGKRGQTRIGLISVSSDQTVQVGDGTVRPLGAVANVPRSISAAHAVTLSLRQTKYTGDSSRRIAQSGSNIYAK